MPHPTWLLTFPPNQGYVDTANGRQILHREHFDGLAEGVCRLDNRVDRPSEVPDGP